jgi:hypothetical protein
MYALMSHRLRIVHGAPKQSRPPPKAGFVNVIFAIDLETDVDCFIGLKYKLPESSGRFILYYTRFDSY